MRYLAHPSRLVVATALAGLAIAAALIPWPSTTVETFYAARFYPRVQHLLTPIANRVPFAALDVMAVGALSWFVWRLTAEVRRRGASRALGIVAIDLVLVASITYLWFLTTWGLNYRRVPLESHLDFDRARIDREAVTRLANRAVFELNRLYPIAHGSRWVEFEELGPVLGGPFGTARELVGARWQPVAGRSKWSLLDFYFRHSGVDGMTDPFFLEVIVNHDVLPFERPFVLAHEWAHLGGSAQEAEASFIAWLACVRGHAQHQYSAWLFLYPELVVHLPREERRSLTALLDAGPRRDFDSIRARLERASPVVRRAASRVYDRYLRANRVPDGIESYRQVVQLIAGTRFKEGWVPVSR